MKKNKNLRRKGVLQRLQNQLEKGSKNVDGIPTKLTEKDLARISREMSILLDRTSLTT